MNKQIKELAIKAGLIAPYGSDLEGLREFDYRMFAELIVRECISIVNEQKECLHEEEKYWHDRDYGYEMAVNDASKGIKQFFGVEE